MDTRDNRDHARLTLRLVDRSHAAAMFTLLSDTELYRFTGGSPPASVEEVETWFSALESRQSPDGSERWLTWIVQLESSRTAIGYVQSTIAGNKADVAWLIGTSWQGNGYAREAVRQLGAWLQEEGMATITARIHPHHRASQKVASSLGLSPSGEYCDGEEIWSAGLAGSQRRG